MDGQHSTVWKVGGYLSLFLVSFLIFDSVSVILGVAIALFAFYYFSRKGSGQDPL